MKLFVIRSTGGTYWSLKSPTVSAASSCVPVGLQFAELMPLSAPAYSMTTLSRREPATGPPDLRAPVWQRRR